MYKRIRIKATGQVLDMVPHVADRMIAGGTAELVISENKAIESQAVAPRAERAVTPAQAGPGRKTRKSA
jgi:hypothetical protein